MHIRKACVSKNRGRFENVLKQYIRDRIGDCTDILSSHVFMTHAGCDEHICEQYSELIRELLPDAEIHVTRAGCTVSVHCGKNTLGVLFIRKRPIE